MQTRANVPALDARETAWQRKNARDVLGLHAMVKLPGDGISGAFALDGRTCEVEGE